MKKHMRGFVLFFVCITLIFSSSIPIFATNDNNNGNARSFRDVQENHWAYEDIMWMLSRNIIDGTGNNMFSPNGIVTRAEFAKMMVNTLNLQRYTPDTPFFLDVKKSAWEYSYVEGARFYLTGFTSSNGDYFRPAQAAVREDMAVALVKALGYQNETPDESILNRFADTGSISPKLRKYVALSVKHGLIEGSAQNGQYFFKPMGNLTRAEAAKLLHRAFKNNEEKITYDDDKVTYDEDTYIKPSVTVTTENNRLVVSWNKINSTQLVGYAVVISANDSTPKYPENGYLYYFTDKNQTSAVIDNSVQYNGTSDFGKYLEKDKKYYISVTAVYNNNKYVAGNAVRKTYPGANDPNAYTAPVSYATIENGKLVIKWNKIDSSYLNGYKIVISKYDSTPKYPDNGYLYNITNKNTTSAVIDNRDAYNGTSDFGQYLTKGEKYYFSVTAVYNDRNVAGNAFQYTYPGNGDEHLYPAPVSYATIENGKLVMKWNKIDSPYFNGYRIVISKYDSSPKYPDNGYLYNITDKNTTSAIIDNRAAYNGTSDFGQYLVKGEKYYFNVTAVYNNKNVAGNTIQYTYPGNGDEHLYPAPAAYTNIENGNLVVRWNRNTSNQFKEYRVVISKNKTAPKYPEDGHLYKITDRNRTYAVINNDDKYNGGDFGNYLTKGDIYYISITTVYNDRNVPGNAIQFKYEGKDNPESYIKPVVTAVMENGRLVLRWNKIDSSNLVSYRVVASKNDSTPGYPENGYLYKITDRNRNYAVIDSDTAYTDGDFGSYLIKGEKYYFSVTAEYTDKNVAGNAIQREYTGDDNPALFPAPVVTAAYVDGKLVVSWNKIESPQLLEYRLVISQNSQTPAYPANGFYSASFDKNTTTEIIDASKPYTGGDFNVLTDGTEYYFSVTAVYANNKYVSGNAVRMLYVLPLNQ